MLRKIPSARNIDKRLLGLVVAMPLVAATFIASGVVATNDMDVIGEAGGVLAFVMGFAKFCYLAVAAAHLSSGLVDRTDGGLAAPGWLDGSTERREAVRPDHSYWQTFPNHFDGAAIALAITLGLACFL